MYEFFSVATVKWRFQMKSHFQNTSVVDKNNSFQSLQKKVVGVSSSFYGNFQIEGQQLQFKIYVSIAYRSLPLSWVFEIEPLIPLLVLLGLVCQLFSEHAALAFPSASYQLQNASEPILGGAQFGLPDASDSDVNSSKKKTVFHVGLHQYRSRKIPSIFHHFEVIPIFWSCTFRHGKKNCNKRKDWTPLY